MFVASRFATRYSAHGKSFRGWRPLMATLNKPSMPPSSSTTLVHAEDNNLVDAILHKRYKRFLADCEVNGVMEVVFCPNTGPMTGLLDHLPCPAKLSVSDKPGRKYRYQRVHKHTKTHLSRHSYTLEWLQPNPSATTWVGVHSARANEYVAAMLDRGLLQPLLGVSPTHETRREVAYGTRSRVDFVLEEPGCQSTLYVEVKSVTMTEQEVAVFPDTVSTRAQQHARELTALVEPDQGHKRRRVDSSTRAAMLFVVQRDDVVAFAPCGAKDPAYAALCVEAAKAGVKLVAVAIRLDEQGGVVFVGSLPVKATPATLTPP